MVDITHRFAPTSLMTDYRRGRVQQNVIEALERRREQTAAAAAARTAVARRAPPEQATRERRALENTPFAGVEREPGRMDGKLLSELERRVQEKRDREFFIDNPRTADWALANDDLFASHDDLDTVGAFESMGRAVSKSIDATADNASIDYQLQNLRDIERLMRDRSSTLEELQEDAAVRAGTATRQPEQVQADQEGLRERVSQLQQRSTDFTQQGRLAEAQQAQQEAQALEAQLAPEDQADEPSFVQELSSDAAGLYQFLRSRLNVPFERAEGAADPLRDAQEGLLSDRGFEAREREGLWPTPRWRREIQQQLQAGENDGPMQALGRLATIASESPARFAQFMLEVSAESLPGIAAAAGTMYATRNPVLAASVAGLHSFERGRGMAFDEFVQSAGHDLSTTDGVKRLLNDPAMYDRLREKGFRYGAVIGIFDAVSMGVAGKSLSASPAGNMLLQVMAQSTAGGLGEMFGRLAADEDIVWTEVFIEALAEMTTAPLEVGAMGGGMATQKMRQIKETNKRRKMFDILSGKINESQLRKRDRATFESAITEVTKNGPLEDVRVDPARMEEMFQESGAPMSLEEFFEATPELDIRDFNEARDSGSDFVIPMGVYSSRVVGSPVEQMLADHVRLRPEDMSRSDADQFMSDLQRTREQLAEGTDVVSTSVGELRGMIAGEFERMRSELTQAGRAPALAEKEASLLVRSAVVGAERAGMPIDQYVARYSLPAIRNVDTVGPAPERPLLDPDLALELITSSDPSVENVPDVAAIRQLLDDRGLELPEISREDILSAARELADAGELRGQLPMEEQARPADVDTTGRDEETFEQTATLRVGEEDPRDWGIDPTRSNKVRDVAVRLQERQRKRYGKINRKTRGPKTVQKMASWMADEIEFEMQTPDASASGWYTTKYQNALDNMSQSFPEFAEAQQNSPLKGVAKLTTPEEARAVFTMALAITSNGAKVVDNFKMATQVYRHWRQEGVFPTDMTGISDRGSNTRKVFTRLNTAMADRPVQDVVDDMLAEETVREANKQLRAQGDSTITKFAADTIVPRSATVLGPKLGSFFANLMGSEGYLTMDLWWTRTINRYRGDVLPRVVGLKGDEFKTEAGKRVPQGLARFKALIGRPDLSDKQALNYATEYADRYREKGYKDGSEAEKAANTIHKAAFVQLAETPEGAADRTFMIEVARAARDEVERRTGQRLTIADTQAMIWYYEKRLYADMGVRDSGDISYEEAATRALKLEAQLELFQTDELYQATPPVGAEGGTDGAGQAVGGQAPLPGAPTVEGASGPDANLVTAAEQYAAERGLTLGRQAEFAKVDPEFATRVAEAYEAMPHAPQDPEVAEAYAELIQQTKDQYDVLTQNGYVFTFFDDDTDPYAGNPWNAMRDLRANKTMAVYGTYAGYGTEGVTDSVDDNPLLADTGLRWPVAQYTSEQAAGAIQKLAAEGADLKLMALEPGQYAFDGEEAHDGPEVWMEWLGSSRSGAGTETMEAVTRRADLTNTVLRLEVDPAGDTDRLLDFYGRFGFEGDPDGGDVMERQPRVVSDTFTRPVTANDLFRAVHDAFGHGIEGAGFRARGEENAWQAHARLFYGKALAALTTETRGQNSWLNYGPYGETNRTAGIEDTVFAEQKTGLLPEWAWTENVVEQEDPQTFDVFYQTDAPVQLRDFDADRISEESFRKPGWFAMSATVDDAGPATGPRNRERANELARELTEKGLPFKTMNGFYKGSADGRSFLVIGDSATGAALAAKWRQESILTKDGLVYTDASGRDNVPFDGVTIGAEAEKGDFYSKAVGEPAFSLNLQFPAPPDLSAEGTGGKSHYGAELVDGKVILTHWSNAQLDAIDPGMAGTGPLRGEERRRGGPPKVYFGLHIGKPYGYQREYSLGDYRHVVALDPERLYPWREDPDGLKDKIDRSKYRSAPERVNRYEELIREAGYAGYMSIGGGDKSIAPLGDTVALFEAVTPDRVEIDNDASWKRSQAFNDWFGESVVTNEDGSPRMVYHGSLERGLEVFDTTLVTERGRGDEAGTYFTSDPGTASNYTRPRIGDRENRGKRGQVYAAYLNLRNPLDTTDEIARLQAAGASFGDAKRAALEKLDRAVHDGVVFRGDDLNPAEFVVFRPEQIKSADNRGNWDPNNENILEQKREEKSAAPRGSVILPKDLTGQATIQLFETANLSTVLHETGHYFLWNLQRQASDALPFAQEQYEEVKNWWRRNSEAIAAEAGVEKAQVEEFLELGTTGRGQIDKAVHRALHEQFARGFEAYAMEGKSPSNTMRSLFENFAAWLVQTYRGLTDLNVRIDDGLRAVFDRMVATDDEIAGVMDREAIDDQIARTAREMGLDEDSYRRLTMLSEEARDEGKQLARKELLRVERRMRSAEYQARLAEIDAEETERVNGKPRNRAVQWLAYGRWLGGEGQPEGLPLELRFDTELLVEQYGDIYDNLLQRLPRGRRPVYVKDSGLSADEVAGWFGFGSGAELLEAMINGPDAREEIKARVKARVAEEVGDPMGDRGELEETVVDAMHGEKRGQVIVAELRAMNRLGGKNNKVTTRSIAAQIARELIQKMPVREALQTNRFQSAERRHAEEATRALAAGDVDAAFEAKRKQLIQHQLYIESRKTAEMVGKAERLAGRLKRKGTRENLAPEYLGAIDDLLETYDFRKVSGKAEVRRERLKQYVESMISEGRDNELAIPDDVLNNAKRRPYKTLSVQRLQGVFDSLKNIEHMARRKKKLIDAQDARDRQEIIDEIKAEFDENIKGKPFNRVETPRERTASGIQGYFNLVRNADTILRKIDGWRNRGAAARHFKDRIDRAGIRAMQMREDASEALDGLFDAYTVRERRSMATRRVWDGYEQALSKWDLISMALNVGNKDNYERLTSRDTRGSFSPDQVKTLLSNLDGKDWRFVQSVWDYLDNTFWPQIAEREERVTGVAPTKVESKMMVEVGSMPREGLRGGYYPIKYDRRASSSVREDQNLDLMQNMMAGRFGKAQTKNGHTKERASGGGGRTLQLGMQVLFGHVNNVVHDLAFGEAVNTSWSLLREPEVRSEFEKAGMLPDYEALEVWLQDVAAGPASGTHTLAGTLRRMKSGFTLSKLAFNMSTVAVQVTGAAQSVSVVGADNFMRGLQTYLFSARGRFQMANDIKDRSPFMRERETSFQRDVFDLINSTQFDPLRGITSEVLRVIMKAGFYAMQKVQYYAIDVPTWLGAHHQGLREGMTEEEAATHADRMVARAQASGLYADRSAIERGTLGQNQRQNEFLRLFTALGSYMFAKYNVAEEVIGRTRRDIADSERNTAFAILKGTTDLVLLFVVEALLYQAIRGGLPGQGDDDEDEQSWGTFLAQETALSIASVFPFVRDISSAVQGFGGGGTYGGISETFGRALSSSGDVLMGEATASDARSLLDLTGLMVPGVPSTAIWRIVEGAGATGEEPSPLAMIMGR